MMIFLGIVLCALLGVQYGYFDEKYPSRAKSVDKFHLVVTLMAAAVVGMLFFSLGVLDGALGEVVSFAAAMIAVYVISLVKEWKNPSGAFHN